MPNLKDIILLNIYRTDFLAPQLKGAVKQAIVDQLFSRTILVGKESVRISHSDISKLTGISTITISRAMKELIRDRIIRVLGSYKPRTANEYGLNIQAPTNLQIWFSAQRDPRLVLNEVSGVEAEVTSLTLTAEGEAVINSIKDSMSVAEKEIYKRKAQEELILMGLDLTELNIENKITEMLLRSFSDEKRNKYCRT